MIDHANSRITRLFPILSNVASLVILSIAFLSFSGWIFSSPFLKSVLPNLVPMTPNTSVCFILLSISLLNLTKHTAKAAKLRVACASVVITVGVLTLAQYISGLNLGIDSVLFAKAVRAYAIPFPGRMSPVSAVNFTLAGIAILMLGVRSCRNSGIVESIILLVGILGLMTIVGYVLNTPDLYNFKPFKPMALNTAINFILVCLAAFLARLDCGLMSVVSSNTEGGIMARRMLLLVICVPVMLSWLAVTGLRNNFYDVSLGISLLTMITIVVFTLLIWENALSLHMIDLKRMEVEVVLRENEDKYRVIFETTGTATAIFEEDKTISLANTEFEQVSGFSKAEIEGKKLWTEFVATEEDLARMQEYHRVRRIDPTKAPRNYEFKFVDRSGNVKEMLMTIAMIPGTKRSIASLQDITERKRVEQMKSDFVSLVSHQLKTPVAQLKGYIFNMLAGLTGELTAKSREYLEDMQDISNKNYRLLSDLLNVSRIERGVISMDISPVTIREIVDEAVGLYYEQIKAKGLAIQIEGLDNELIVAADKEKTIEAIGNTIHNAVKFTDAGSISVRVSNRENMVIVAVIDTGRGIAPERLSRMFSRDMTFDGAPIAGGGAGLGLYIAKQFMRLQHGDIIVQSMPGKGSSFIFTIPMA